jgi:hypothetical protein
MRILFLGRHDTYFRNFEGVLRELATRGHQIHLAVEQEDVLGGSKLVTALSSEFPHITYGRAPGRPEDDWSWVATRLRLGLDYLRYLHPTFDQAYKLRERARGRTPSAFVALGVAVRAAGDWARRAAVGLLRRLERAVPEVPDIRAFISAQRPDVVLLTPLIDLGSSQIEYLRAARALRVPTALCVWSWDHLSSKALIRESPDRVFVWNETQKREAIELHGVGAEQVVVTGAQCFDQWFDRAPSRRREDFCRAIGLDPARPYLLWVCSALIHGSPVEATFVLDWIRRIRSSPDPALRDVGILVRPHPSRLAEWEGASARGLGAVVWGSNPVDEQARADYFDSLHYSAAVVGLNTSAFIEAGIAGRPVFTIISPEFEENQYGTVHFRYLLEAGGGLVTVAHGLGEHVTQLVETFQRPPEGVRPFVREFVRPRGLDCAATPIFVAAVEAMEGMRAAETPSDLLASTWRWLLPRIAQLKDREYFERWTLSPRELASAGRLRELRTQKAIRRAMSRAANDEHRLRKLQARAVRVEESQRRRVAARAAKPALPSSRVAGAATRGRD